jgi:AraC-like DNA-binding protein
MSNEKIFTDSKLTIDKLAGLLNTTRHHLSQVLNERIRRPYNEYISDLRLEEAQLRLSDPKSFRYTIASIALDSGFSTVSTFNEAFKKKFGMTPSAFRHQPSNQKSA